MAGRFNRTGVGTSVGLDSEHWLWERKSGPNQEDSGPLRGLENDWVGGSDPRETAGPLIQDAAADQRYCSLSAGARQGTLTSASGLQSTRRVKET